MSVVASEVSGLEAAAARFRNASDEIDQARAELADEIVKAARARVRQVHIVRITGYTRERVRQICRAAGVEPQE